MRSSLHPSTLNAITCKPFRRTLLPPLLHNFRALAPANLLDGMTYRQFCAQSRKSFTALLLAHVSAVSPLLRYSYKKMGGTPSLPLSGHQVTQASACVGLSGSSA